MKTQETAFISFTVLNGWLAEPPALPLTELSEMFRIPWIHLVDLNNGHRLPAEYEPALEPILKLYNFCD